MFVRYGQYRAIDTDIPAKPRFLLFDASDDAIARLMCCPADEKTGRPKAPDNTTRGLPLLVLAATPSVVQLIAVKGRRCGQRV